MPDFQNFSITRNGSVNFNMPRYTVTCNICDSSSGQRIKEFNVNFPDMLRGLTAAQLNNLFEEIIGMIIRKRMDENNWNT